MQQCQLNIQFESPMLQAMEPNERANAVTQLAALLLQAAGIQATGANNDER